MIRARLPRRSRRTAGRSSPTTACRSSRAVVGELARDAGYRVREGSFTLAALTGADEAFASSAVREIVPVIAVDGRELPRGEAAVTLQALLEAVDA